ncbi:hypothetical protein AA309_15980, partial [Microvirga vignae]
MYEWYATNLDAPALREASLDQILHAWAAEEGQGEDENRQEVVRRIRAWVAAGDVGAWLDLSFLSLTCLPAALPAGLLWLDTGCNRLTSLPATLPAGLQRLNAGGNELT